MELVMHLSPQQWAIALLIALMLGISKTGLPGVGIFAVIVLAQTFGARLSVGIMLPMLICGDIFAVFWYRRHAHWDKLLKLLPWVVFGMLFGTIGLEITGESKSDVMNTLIGSLVLFMLMLHLLRKWLGDRLTPTSRIGVAATGTAAGFATTVSNAAGPIMQIFLSTYKLPKEEFMGTIAWYFFIINVAKFPIYAIESMLHPKAPMVTLESLSLNAAIAPAIIVGAFLGKWLLPRIPQKAFEDLILLLAGIGAVRMFFM